MTQSPQDDEERIAVKLTLRRSTFEALAAVAQAGDLPLAVYIRGELERLVERSVAW